MAMRQSMVRLFGCAGAKLDTFDTTVLNRKDDVVITIPKNVSFKKLARMILSMPPGTDPTGGGQKVPAPTDRGGVQTPIDMDVGPILSDDNSYCRIRILCRDRDVRFAEDNYAVTAADADGQLMFFNLSYDPPVKGFSIVSFDCVRLAGGPGIGAYNIGLVIEDFPFELPIIIDPKIQNRG
jgi:hypothetical protein